MPPIYKTLRVTLALVAVLICCQSLVAQQWPVGQVPVENPVPQYRPRNVQSASPSNPASDQGAPPFDFFNENSLPQPRQEPSSLRPSIPQATPPKQELLEVNPIKPEAVKSKTVEHKTEKPRVDRPTAPSKSATAKKTVKKETPKKKVAKKKEKPQPVLNNEIYRDQSVYPIDPRKPNWPCAGGKCKQQGCQCQSCLALGNQGQPYRERELGGCECDTCKPTKHPNFSVHWPRPFSAKIDAHHPEAACARYSGCQPKRVVDVFDGLASFKLSDYKRTDNGYCGPDADPYGCLGESKLR